MRAAGEVYGHIVDELYKKIDTLQFVMESREKEPQYAAWDDVADVNRVSDLLDKAIALAGQMPGRIPSGNQ